jgi:sterol desaturase/sphingolipid hydroxylase (fatty acid hydroxylase superfamily)
VSEYDFNLVRSAGFVLAVAIAAGLQRLAPHARLRGSWAANCGLWGVNLLVLGAVCGACACTVAHWARAAGIGLFALVPAPRWLAIVLSVLALDMVSYAWHRANHRLRVLWRFHQVHHSDVTFTVSTGVRFHPGELLLSLPLRLGAIVLLGVPPEGVVVFEVVFNIANLVEHGDTNLPAFAERICGRVFITPALHRWHHSRRWAELDSNFGTIFAVWDRVLGTYQTSSSATAVETGLPNVLRPTGFVRALLLPGVHPGR